MESLEAARKVEGKASPKRKFKASSDRLFPYRYCRGSNRRRKILYLLVAIDRTSKFAFVELRETVSRRDAADFPVNQAQKRDPRFAPNRDP